MKGKNIQLIIKHVWMEFIRHSGTNSALMDLTPVKLKCSIISSSFVYVLKSSHMILAVLGLDPHA